MNTRCLLPLLTAAAALAAPSLMPLPAHMTLGQGRLSIDRGFHVALSGRGDEPRVHAAALRLISRLATQTGIPLDTALAEDPGKAALVIEWSEDGMPVQRLAEDESYHLTVAVDQARLRAPNPLGVLRGIETFLQLVEPDRRGFAVPVVTIDDAPRFVWRGLMIDVSRHWIPTDAILRNLDGMAAVKLNVLHWHLSDDQGFRVESKRFPKLAGLGSDGNYYTQDQLREVIAYARQRGIRVVPEFDMPGHAQSWLVGYHELAAGNGPFEISRTWGVNRELIDPTRESTYELLDAFIGEMAALFTDEYFHIGGDEVDDHEWKANSKIEDFIRTNGLKDSPGLQAYFNKRVQKIVAKYGKHMEGWDEILNAELPRNIVIQSWRGDKALAEAARMGFQAILSHNYYLDLMESAGFHYAVDPLGSDAAKLKPEEQARILGGEAAMWAEYITPETIDLRIWPRMAAIAERFWSPQPVTDAGSMYQRLEIMSQRLDAFGLTHRSHYAPMLERIAGNAPAARVRVLADVIEPGKGYSRNESDYTQQTPLNRLVDAVRPESMRAREFGAIAKRIAASRDSSDIAEARLWLTLWSGNDAALQPAIQESFLAKENARLSKDLASAAATGLEALRAIEARRAQSAAWVKSRTAELEAMKRPKAELHLAVIAAVEELVEASAVRGKAKR